MEEGRRGELDLPAVLQPSVQRNDPADDLPLRGQHSLLVGLRELAPLGRQLPQSRVLRQGPMAEPGEIVPHLEIQQVLGGEPAGQGVDVLLARVCAALDQQTVIPVVRMDHRVPVGAEEVSQDKDALVAAQVRRLACGVCPEQIRDRPVRLFLELEEERGGQVHRDSHVRLFIQQDAHVEIAFDCVQPHPGQGRGLRQRVGVIGLVQMPEERNGQFLHESYAGAFAEACPMDWNARSTLAAM